MLVCFDPLRDVLDRRNVEEATLRERKWYSTGEKGSLGTVGLRSVESVYDQVFRWRSVHVLWLLLRHGRSHRSTRFDGGTLCCKKVPRGGREAKVPHLSWRLFSNGFSIRCASGQRCLLGGRLTLQTKVEANSFLAAFYFGFV